MYASASERLDSLVLSQGKPCRSRNEQAGSTERFAKALIVLGGFGKAMEHRGHGKKHGLFVARIDERGEARITDRLQAANRHADNLQMASPEVPSEAVTPGSR